MTVCPEKTPISLGHLPSLIISLDICPVWWAPLVSTWRNLGSLAIHWAHSEESDHTGWMPRLVWVFAGRTHHFVGFVRLPLTRHQQSLATTCIKWAGPWENVSYVICEQQRRRSAYTSAQSDQRLCFHCLDSIISVDIIVKISRL